MSSTDRAAIGWSIGIVAVAVGIAFYGQAGPVTDVTPAAQVTAPQAAPAAPAETRPVDADPPGDAPSQGGQPGMAGDAAASSDPATVRVSVPYGTNLPGCEDDDACLVPSAVDIRSGDTVSWTNHDDSSHTVTSGSPSTGPTGVFDSSLMISGETFKHTFEEPGIYEYYCLVHPWVLGVIRVG